MIEQPGDHGWHGIPTLDLKALDEFEYLGRIVPATGKNQRVSDHNGTQLTLADQAVHDVVAHLVRTHA